MEAIMQDFKFDSKETEEYYLKTMHKYHMGNPEWDSDRIITRDDVDNYIKDAENILNC